MTDDLKRAAAEAALRQTEGVDLDGAFAWLEAEVNFVNTVKRDMSPKLGHIHAEADVLDLQHEFLVDNLFALVTRLAGKMAVFREQYDPAED